MRGTDAHAAAQPVHLAPVTPPGLTGAGLDRLQRLPRLGMIGRSGGFNDSARVAQMVTAFELAGFVAAHAVWCVCDGEDFALVVAFTTSDGKRNLERLVFGTATASVEHGRRRLDDAPLGSRAGVLAYDAQITGNGRARDAILL
jgi:hypothetical protein